MVKQQQFSYDWFKNKKVLVTGDTGFKGSWLALWLHHLGADVYGIGLPVKTPQDNFVTAGVGRYIQHTDTDINDFAMLDATVRRIQPEIVFHLAAQPIVLESYRNPLETFATNIQGTAHLLEALRTVDSVRTIIVVTTDKCYQNKEWVWGYRENDPLGGYDPYSASKACTEIVTHSYIQSFFSKSDTRVATVRAGNVIGGGDWAEYRIVPDFFRAVKHQQALHIRYPHATRPWQHVLEPLAGYLHTAEFISTQPYNHDLTAWNFGPHDANHKTVSDVIQHLQMFSHDKPSVEMGNTPALHEAHLLKLDISKAQTYLQWQPKLSFTDTMQMTVAGYESELRAQHNDTVYEHRLHQIQQYMAR